MEYAVRSISVGTFEEPGYAVFWQRNVPEWVTLRLQLVLIEGDGIRALVNTALPDDLSALHAEFPKALMWQPEGVRGGTVRRPEELQRPALAAAGVTPEEITHVILTPIVRYTTDTLDQFPNAKICMLKSGWVHYQTTHRHPHDSRAAFSRDTLVHLVTDWWDRVVLLDDEDEIAPGLRTWFAGVHHRSTMVVEADTAERRRGDQRRVLRLREHRGPGLAPARAERKLRGDVPNEREGPADGAPHRAAVRPGGLRAASGRCDRAARIVRRVAPYVPFRP